MIRYTNCIAQVGFTIPLKTPIQNHVFDTGFSLYLLHFAYIYIYKQTQTEHNETSTEEPIVW